MELAGCDADAAVVRAAGGVRVRMGVGLAGSGFWGVTGSIHRTTVPLE